VEKRNSGFDWNCGMERNRGVEWTGIEEWSEEKRE
jgi:hypothetical protein